MQGINRIIVDQARNGFIVSVETQADDEQHVFTSWRQVITFLRKLDGEE